MTLKTRLTLAFSLLAILIVGLIVANFSTVKHAEDYSAMLVNDHIAPIRDLKTLSDDYAVSIVDNVHKTRSGAVGWEEARTTMKHALDDAKRTWAQVVQHDTPPDELTFLDAIKASMAKAEPEVLALQQILSDEDNTALVSFAEHRLYQAIDPITADIGAYALHLENAAFSDIAEEARLGALVEMLMWIGAAIAVGLMGYGGYVAILSVSGRLDKIKNALTVLASGRTDITIPFVNRTDEIGQIAGAAEVFRANGEKLALATRMQLEERKALDAHRRQMMLDLTSAFGAVVSSACDGDLEPRVTEAFDDPELVTLANDINRLLDRVAEGLAASGAVLGSMARSDLTQRVNGQFRGAFRQLQDNTNAVATRLSDVIGEVQVASSSLRTATGEILAGANDLANRTSRQAATIEETTAAMEQLASTVTDNSRRAEEAAGQGKVAANTAEKGGEAMSKATSAMHRISKSSGEISGIIGLIDDIAFQTNLLALNASVEAARAGDAGKGFAVVAQEVRRLAQSAASSSSQVKGLIEQSSRDVFEGETLVASAADSITTLLKIVRNNASTMEAISHASREQAGAIGSVSEAVRQLDEMTQHNAALVEETNAAIEQTERLATGLDGMIEHFRLPGSESGKKVLPLRKAG